MGDRDHDDPRHRGERVRPGPLDAGLGTLPNPFGIDALAGILGLVQTLYFPAIAALGVICVGSLFVRFRRSGAVERQQVSGSSWPT